jgi:hypothetical protein
MTVKSTCNCHAGGVSKRTPGLGCAFFFSGARNALSWQMPPV